MVAALCIEPTKRILKPGIRPCGPSDALTGFATRAVCFPLNPNSARAWYSRHIYENGPTLNVDGLEHVRDSQLGCCCGDVAFCDRERWACPKGSEMARQRHLHYCKLRRQHRKTTR